MESILRYFRLWKDLARSYRTISSMRWLVLGCVVGVAAGLAAVLFHLGVESGSHLLMKMVAGIHLPHPAGESLFESGGEGSRAAYAVSWTVEAARPWMIPIMTTAVGLFTGFLVQRFIPETVDAGTDGTDAMIKAFHRSGGVIRPVVALIKSSTSILTISSGGSAGVEGPISQLGASIGSFLANRLGLTVKERRILLLAGAAGGLGAIFRAPMGGALTAIEVIYKEDFEAEAVLPAVLSSVVAYTIFTFFFGAEPIFGIPRFTFVDARELLFYLVLALVCTLAGWLYVKCFFTIKYQVFARLRDRLGIMWTTAIGGLSMGLFGMLFPHVLTGGYGWLELAILGQVPTLMMLAIVFGKTLATSMTLGSGMSGGMFAPALFVGGMSGGVVGKLGHQFFPSIVHEPGSYVLVGMTAFFAAVANAPIGPLFMVCELTKGYGLLAPLMLAAAVCIVLGHHFSLYENQVDSKFDSPAHIGDMTINVLEALRVKEVFKPGRVTALEEGTTLKAMANIIAGTTELNFPVRGEDGRITGMLGVQDVRKVLFEQCLFDLIVVRDLASPPAHLHLDDDLYTALLAFVDTGYSQIPVVDDVDETEILGMVNRQDVFKAYSEAIRKVKEAE